MTLPHWVRPWPRRTGRRASSRGAWQRWERPFSLSWWHHVFLLGIKQADERDFYQIETSSQDWAVRELRRRPLAVLGQHAAGHDRIQAKMGFQVLRSGAQQPVATLIHLEWAANRPLVCAVKANNVSMTLCGWAP